MLNFQRISFKTKKPLSSLRFLSASSFVEPPALKKSIFIDASPILHRCFHATLKDQIAHTKMQEETSVDPTPPRMAVLCFVKSLVRLLSSFHPFHEVGVILDSPGPCFRNQIDPLYKANRKSKDERLEIQLHLIKDICAALNIVSISIPGYEADDVLATYASLAARKDRQVIVVSTDKDLMQVLRSPNVSLYNPPKRAFVTEADVISRFGVPPSLIAEVQALSGDPGDNYNGIRGIGPKTAAELLL